MLYPDSIKETLGGQLCRCIRYRPIIDSAVQIYELPLEDPFATRATRPARTTELITTPLSETEYSAGQVRITLYA